MIQRIRLATLMQYALDPAAETKLKYITMLT